MVINSQKVKIIIKKHLFLDTIVAHCKEDKLLIVAKKLKKLRLVVKQPKKDITIKN